MGSRARSILTKIKADIQGINGTGSYNYDLSGSDQVVIGSQMNPVRVPCVYVYCDTATASQIAGTTPLTMYSRTMQVMVVGYVAGTDDSPEELHLRTWDLLADLKVALEADRSLTVSGVDKCDDLELSMTSTDGAQIGRPSLGIAVVSLTVKYRQNSGSGS